MKDFKLIQTLKTLSKKEIKEFRNYLYCFYSGRKKLIELFDLLDEHHPLYDSHHIMIKVISEKMNVARKIIVNNASILNKIVDEFLAWSYMKNNSYQKDFILLNVFEERGNTSAFQNQIISLERKLKKEKIQNDEFYLRFFKINLEKYFNSKSKALKVNQKQFLINALSNLDSFYSLTKLKLGLEFLNRSHILSEEYKMLLLDRLVDLCQEGRIITGVTHDAYLTLFRLFSTKNYGEFKYIYELVFKKSTSISLEDKRLIINYLTSFSLSIIRNDKEEGNISKIQDLFNLFSLGLKEKVFLKKGRLPANIFLNICNVALSLNKFDWVKQFIYKQGKLLDSAIRESTFNLALGYYYFYTNQFNETIRILNLVNYVDYTYNLRATVLRIMSFYELEINDRKFSEFIYYSLIAFEKSLRRNNVLNKSIIDAHLNFVKIMRNIIHNNRDKNKILENIKRLNNIVSREWLLKKISESKHTVNPILPSSFLLAYLCGKKS